MNPKRTDLFLRVLAAALPGGALVAGLSSTASAGPAPAEIPNALVITKSSNKNQVNYAVQVNDACVPAGRSPVHPYWRMLERGSDATEPLVDSELRAFGVERQSPGTGGVNVVLRAMPARAITIRTWRTPDGTCASSASMTISGVPARVTDVYVRQKLFGIDYVQITGATAAGEVVRERISL
ncbi:MAG TPA: DUF4833 domain-containing protein [Polyangiaceae bacterium]|jgi:hypothetical protein|nr:DUF4833 domain-containing protein [Polyangiaceae bacterium]